MRPILRGIEEKVLIEAESTETLMGDGGSKDIHDRDSVDISCDGGTKV